MRLEVNKRKKDIGYVLTAIKKQSKLFLKDFKLILMIRNIRLIAIELRNHAPFTLFGALTGLFFIFILIYGNLLYEISPISEDIFFTGFKTSSIPV